MKNFRPTKLLLAIDFSKESLNALNTAIAIAQDKKRASLTLIQVISPSEKTGPQHQAATSLKLRQANERLNVLAKSLSSKNDFHIAYNVQTGIPATAICNYAAENTIDLIILGTKTFHGVRNLFTEAMAYKVVKGSPCPVLSVPGARLFTRFKKVVYPVRNAPHMLAKYDFVRPILNKTDSTLMITGLAKVNNAESFATVSVTMDALKDKLGLDHVSHASSVHFCDNISSSLLEISNQQKPDLVVIIASIDNSLKGFFFDHYAKSIISKASCPVLSIRPDMAIVN